MCQGVLGAWAVGRPHVCVCVCGVCVCVCGETVAPQELSPDVAAHFEAKNRAGGGKVKGSLLCVCVCVCVVRCNFRWTVI